MVFMISMMFMGCGEKDVEENFKPYLKSDEEIRKAIYDKERTFTDFTNEEFHNDMINVGEMLVDSIAYRSMNEEVKPILIKYRTAKLTNKQEEIHVTGYKLYILTSIWLIAENEDTEYEMRIVFDKYMNLLNTRFDVLNAIYKPVEKRIFE